MREDPADGHSTRARGQPLVRGGPSRRAAAADGRGACTDSAPCTSTVAPGRAHRLPGERVEVTFVGVPPVRQIERASGVSEVEVDGPTLRCLVCGSFQPFLEALRGHEVVDLRTAPASIGIHETATGDSG